MFFRGSDFYPSRISDPGTRIPDPATAIKGSVFDLFSKMNIILFMKKHKIFEPF
jgi:hypothetical protein